MRVSGFMSGTSLDGVDAAILETDGYKIERFGPAIPLPFTDDLRAAVVAETEARLRADRAGITHSPNSSAKRAAALDLPEPLGTWMKCDGERHNPPLMQALLARIGDARSIDDFGLRGDFIEAEGMAFLAARSARRVPSTFPGTTGNAGPTTGARRFNSARGA